MKRVLYLTQRLPFPPNKGEKIRQYEVLRYLQRSFKVSLGTLVDDPADLAHVQTVQDFCPDAYIGTLDRRRAKVFCMRGLLTGDPLSVTFYRHTGLASWVKRQVAEVKPHLIFVCSSNMAPYVLDLPRQQSRFVVDLTDVDSEKWRAYAASGSGPMRAVYRREWRQTAKLESRIAREADASLFVSAQEAALFKRQHPQQAGRVHSISNGVDHAYFDPARPTNRPFDERPHFVFTGTMNYRPNVEAVDWFAHDILPRIRRVLPEAQFMIVGANPAPAVAALGELAGVSVTGRVGDVRPYIAHAVACVAPMRIARGIQNKVLEAMSMARPVIVTSDALEGIDAAPSTEVLLADTPEEFAACCLAAVEPASAAIGQAARRRVIQDYTWSERLRGLDALLLP